MSQLTLHHGETQELSPGLNDILQRVLELRGERVWHAVNLPLAALLDRPAQTIRFCRSDAIAPLAFFKPVEGCWVPKIVISLSADWDLDLAAHIALSAACRTFGVETMCITGSQLAAGYLRNRHFKEALNGAYFCDAKTNRTVFCPALRAAGLYQWPSTSAPQSPPHSFNWRR